MNERPILMSTPMVRAILQNRKTQTRRVMKPQPELGRPWKNWTIDPEEMDLPKAYCPYGIRSDRLWIRETWRLDFQCGIGKGIGRSGIRYKADGQFLVEEWASRFYDEKRDLKWRPSIYMPKCFSRITLEITDIRAEQLQSISGRDAILEGWVGSDEARLTTLKVSGGTISGNAAIEWFIELWNSINEKRGYGWSENPWVWMIEFKLL